MSGREQRFAGTVLIHAIRRTEAWWRFLGANMGFERVVVTSPMRGESDHEIAMAFYPRYRRLLASGAMRSLALDEARLDDVIERCRVLRWLPRREAVAMALAMGEVLAEILDKETPTAIVSLPTDCYISDILEHFAGDRGIPYFELTIAITPGLCMFLHRGRLIERDAPADPALVEEQVRLMVDPLFKPIYIPSRKKHDLKRFARTFGYFRLRSLGFAVLGRATGDPLNQHYLDAQSWLGHKVRWSDRAIVGLIDHDWRERIATVPIERRVFIGLQVFPEASIDYFTPDRSLHDQVSVVVEAARAFSSAGFHVLVKDHPQQFGFRQVELIRRLRALPNVTIIPYAISANEMIELCGVSFTCTGTIGMQAALAGRVSVATHSYYSTPEDFILFSTRDEIVALPERVLAAQPPASLPERQKRIVGQMIRGCFEGDYLTYRGFPGDAAQQERAAALGRNIGREIALLGRGGEDWHARADASTAPTLVTGGQDN